MVFHQATLKFWFRIIAKLAHLCLTQKVGLYQLTNSENELTNTYKWISLTYNCTVWIFQYGGGATSHTSQCRRFRNIFSIL